jgi:CheY-like chemotaxis protein
MDPWRWVDPRVREVRLAGLRAYLARRGHAVDAPGLTLPASEQDADFRRSVVELLTALSEAEGRHPVALLDDVLAGQAAGGPVRLLWVENHATFARVAGRQFLSAYDVTVVPTLAAAREALRDAAFAAVLLDYDLDDGKGTELIGTVRQMQPPPVVVATSAKDAGNEALLAAGAQAACNKTRFAQIEAVLRQALAGEGS